MGVEEHRIEAGKRMSSRLPAASPIHGASIYEPGDSPRIMPNSSRDYNAPRPSFPLPVSGGGPGG